MSKSTWSAEATEKLVSSYTSAVAEAGGSAVSLKELAKEHGVSVPAVRGKLVAEKVYVKVEKSAKPAGAVPVRKAELVGMVETLTGSQEGEFSTLEKASKAQLESLITKIESLV